MNNRSMKAISYRCPDWPLERPDITEHVPDHEVRSMIDSIIAEGGTITHQRDGRCARTAGSTAGHPKSQ